MGIKKQNSAAKKLVLCEKTAKLVAHSCLNVFYTVFAEPWTICNAT
jgi:hypothetical protein